MEPTEAHARKADLLLLDVREPEEWDAGHIPGSVHIPMGELPDRLAEVASDRPVLAVCRSGARSARVTSWLDRQGYQAHNLDGGVQGWQQAGYPLETDDGRPGTVA